MVVVFVGWNKIKNKLTKRKIKEQSRTREN